MASVPHLKRCSKCGADKPLVEFYARKEAPDGLRKECKACFRAACHDRYHNNPEYRARVLEKNREYSNARYRHDPERREYQKQWLQEKRLTDAQVREKHLAWARAYKKRRRASDPEYRAREHLRTVEMNRRKRISPDFRARGAASARAYWQRRYHTDPEWRAQVRARQKASTHRRRAQKQQGGNYTAAEWLELCAKYDHRCLCCGKHESLTADHIVPLVRGGSNTIDNIQPLCRSCNSRKGTRTIDYRP